MLQNSRFTTFTIAELSMETNSTEVRKKYSPRLELGVLLIEKYKSIRARKLEALNIIGKVITRIMKL